MRRGECTASGSATISRDGHAGIEAAERVLENDLQLLPERAQLLRRERAQIPSRPHDASGGYRQERQNGARQSRFAAAGLAHHAERLSGAHGEAHRAHRGETCGSPGPRTARAELDAEIAHRELRLAHRSRGACAAVRARAACGAQQCRGVGLARRLENSRHQAFLDDAPGAHDRHPVGDTGDRAEVVRDQHHRHGALALQAREQPQDLRLHGDIERGGRLVRDQQLRPAGECDRDHHALAHAAGELVRVLPHALPGIAHLHMLEQGERARARRGARQLQVPDHDLGELLAHRQVRCQGGHRILEHQADTGATHAVEIRRGEAEQLPAEEARAACGAAVGRQEPEQREEHLTLAGAGLTDHPETLPGRDRQRNVARRRDRATRGGEGHRQVRDLEYRGGRGRGFSAHAGRGHRARRRRTG